MEKIILILLIIVLALLVKGLRQDFFSPAALNIFWNIFFILGAVIFFGGEIEWKYGGIFWILGGCLCYLVGQYCGTRIKTGKVGEEKKDIGNSAVIIIFVLIIFTMLNPYIYIRSFGYSLDDIFNLDKLLQLNAEVAYDRYTGHKFQEGFLQTIVSTFMYFSAIIGGFSFNFQKRFINKVVCIMVFLPCLFLTVITNAKLAAASCTFLWITGWLLSFLNINGDKAVLTGKKIMFGVAALVGGIVFFDFAMLLRYGGIDLETQKIVNTRLQEYMFGQIHSFTVWFSGERDEMLKMGASTYMFIPNWLGLSKKIQGVYELLPGTISNIFTQNRGIIEDFGCVGGLVYEMVLGVVSGVTYKMVKSRSNNCGFAIFILGAIYFSILHGFMISPWVYSTYVVAFVGFGIFLFYIREFNLDFMR